MQTIHTISKLRKLVSQWRRENKKIAFVPTMGNLHDGHLALVKKAQKHADKVIVSIFVNPLQFGPTEDFGRYPRTEKSDLAKLKACHVDVVFLPEINEIYPDGKTSATTVNLPGLSDDLCGITRPRLFYGVTTVVSKLFNIVQPDIAVFGEKDFQQLVILKQMVKDLDFPIKILSEKIIREKDGLALSSRNQYLNQEERKRASTLHQTLCWVREQIKNKNTDYKKLCQLATKQLLKNGFDKVDYVAIRNKNNLNAPEINDKNLIVLSAAFLGNTRLIDNLQFVV